MGLPPGAPGRGSPGPETYRRPPTPVCPFSLCAPLPLACPLRHCVSDFSASLALYLFFTLTPHFLSSRCLCPLSRAFFLSSASFCGSVSCLGQESLLHVCRGRAGVGAEVSRLPLSAPHPPRWRWLGRGAPGGRATCSPWAPSPARSHAGELLRHSYLGRTGTHSLCVCTWVCAGRPWVCPGCVMSPIGTREEPGH